MNWIDDIKTKMDGFEMEPPEGLMESVIPAAVPVRRRYFGYAAGFAIAAGAALLLFLGRPEEKTTSSTPALAEVQTTQAEDFPAPEEVQEAPSTDPISLVPVRNRRKVKGESAAPVIMSTETEAAAAYDESEHLSVKEPEPECEVMEPASRKPEKKNFEPVDFSEPVKVRKARKTELGVLSSYLAQASFSKGGDYFAGPLDGADAVRWDESPLMAMMMNSMREEPAVYTHHLPVRIGMSVEYQVSDRWFVGTGLSYSRLISDIWRGESQSQKIGVQKLDYVGIPVNARFDAFSNRWARAYVTGGVSADKCISNRRENLFGIAGSETTGTDRYDERPFQFSATAGLGAALKLSRMVSIYAEPGLTWYADDNSSLKTIYKERPLSFSVNAGLRFTLGNK